MQAVTLSHACNVILGSTHIIAHTSYLARGSDSRLPFKESRALNFFIMLPSVLLPYNLGTSLQLVLRTQELETLVKTLEQVNKTNKQQVGALIITPLALGTYNVLNKCFGKHSQPECQNSGHNML